MLMFSIILYSLFLIGQSSALIKRRSESDTIIQEQEHELINNVIQSISDINQNIQAVNVRSGFNVETDEVKQSENDFRKNVDENQDIRRILNEIEAEEINNTSLTEDVEQVIHGFLSDLEYYKDKFNQSIVDEIGDHVVIANATDDEENEQLLNNLDNNKMGNVTEDDDEDDVGNDNEPSDQNDDIKDYDPTESPVSGRRIFKGHQTRISQFPFMASVHVMGQFYCAGSIIGSSLVITAASCLQLAWNNRFFRENPKFLYVRVGSTFYNGGGELIQVLEVYFHPGYEPRSLKNNLAILRLRRHIKMSRRNKKRVKKIRYDTHANSLPINTDNLVILGWGAREVGNRITNPMENRLSYASLDFYGLQDCQEIYSKEFVTNRNFCAGFMSKGGGACNRDVGAPGLVGGILAGVVSFGAPVCGAPDAPTVFTKLGYYKDWIEKITDQPFHSYRITTEKFKPYLLKELIATPTTRMISRLPYIDPKVKQALKGVSFLPPTTTPNLNMDSEVQNMLLMSMGRPAIQDQPYYQVDNTKDLSSKVDPLAKLFGFDPMKGEHTDKSSIIASRMSEDLFEKNNEIFIQNNQENSIGKVRIDGISLQLLRDKNQKTKKEKANSKYKLIEKKELINKQKVLQKDRDEQIERNNQKFIDTNRITNLPKQNNRQPNLINDGGQSTPFINFADPEKVNLVASTKRPLERKETQFDVEPVKGAQPSLDYESESIKKPRLPIESDIELETVQKQKRPSKLENYKKPQFPSDDEPERVNKPHLPSDFETESASAKQPSSYEQSGVKKKQDFDPDRDAFAMLDKVVNEIKPNRDNEESQYNDDNNGLILENAYLPTEDIPNSMLDSPNEDVQYVNVESVPMVPDTTEQNIKSPGADAIIQETYLNWDNVNDNNSRERKTKPPKALKKKKNTLETSDLPEKNTASQNFREDVQGLSFKETNIRSHPRYPLTTSEKESELHYAPYRLKPSDHKSDRQYNTNEEPYKMRTESYNILDRANIGNNEYNNIDVTNFNKEDKLDNIQLSMSDVSTQEERYYDDDDNSAASSYSAFSEESGLEIDLPYERIEKNDGNKDVLINVNDSKSLKDEFYHIFADVVSEIAVYSNDTKYGNTN